NYRLGSLGADFTYDPESQSYNVSRILRGDTWDPRTTSALTSPGVDVAVGDVLLAINGQAVRGKVTPGERLVNQSNSELLLTFKRGDGEPHSVTVKAAPDDRPARYRDWVESNR